MTEKSACILETLGLRKTFGELVALDNVSFKLGYGSFHALLGENGAGKSTLVKCIMGYYLPDAGEMLLDNRQVVIANPRDAHDLGIGMVYQHFTLIPNMTVAENFVLSRPRLPAVINWKRELAELETAMQTMPFQVPLNASINSLSAGEKQKVEIIKQLLLNCRILILDEPTSVLTPNEADEVLGKIKAMTKQRDLSVMIITHKFREVMGFADEVTVLRKGKFAGTAKVTDVTPHDLAKMMVGSEIQTEPVQRNAMADTNPEPIVRIEGLNVLDDAGTRVIRDLTLHIKPGEIVGIAGVSGNGQKQLVEILAGQRQPLSGVICLHDETYAATREQMRQHKFHCLPEEPLKNACVANMSVAENLVFRLFDHSPFAWNKLFIRETVFAEHARKLIKQYSIRTPDELQAVGKLSGGNVQRTVLARELDANVDILVVANPCFGLDFAAVAEIHKRIMQARNMGAAVLLVSEDLDEILELSDRFYVISNGALVYETIPQQANLAEIGQYMAGH